MKQLVKLLSDPLWVALLLLPLSILAKNLLGAGHLAQTNNFNKNYFKRGLFKGLLIYAGIGVIALMATISTELSVTLSGTEYTLVQAVIVVLYGAIAVYIKDTFQILLLIFKQTTTEEN